ncbi:MAG: hypothetical protein IJQ39_12635 [Thermoguttaceae bacterium]|nr:hypothetical protein [Thermoguttaceae bacterium]
MSNSNSDEPKLLPGCWLETPWDPGTAGSITEQTHLIDLIPLYKAQWLRYFLLWAIVVGGTLALGVLAPPALNAMNIPVPNLIKLGGTGLDRWLETILLLLTAGTSYLAWRIRRQKPECLTRGWIMFLCVGVFLYMSLDRTAHCAQSLAECINVLVHKSFENNSVTLEPNNVLYWESSVYGIIYLAVLSRLMIEFRGSSMAQLFLLAATAAYACSIGAWFAPTDIKLPLTIEELSGALTLLGDFLLFWSIINYTRYILLDGFGLDGEGWRTAINRYRYRLRRSGRRSSYLQSEADSDSGSASDLNSVSTEQTSDDPNSANSSPFAYDVQASPESAMQYQDPQYSQSVSSVTTSAALPPDSPYNSTTYEQSPYDQPYSQSQQAYSYNPYAPDLYNQTGPPHNPYEQHQSEQPYERQTYDWNPNVRQQTPYEQRRNPYGGSQNYGGSYQMQNPQRQPPPVPPTPVSGNRQPVPNSMSPYPPRANASGSTNANPPSGAAGGMPTAEEVQREFRILEDKIHRQLTHDEKKAVVRRMIRERQQGNRE